jgi:GNAT superfamily N-acetyltransferase
MYTSPDFVRRGIGRLILDLCEAAARAEGYDRVELVATMGGEPLYLACGYEPVERPSRTTGAASPCRWSGWASGSTRDRLTS